MSKELLKITEVFRVDSEQEAGTVMDEETLKAKEKRL